MKHFLPDRHADPFLELETHQRHGAVEHVRRLVDARRRGTATRCGPGSRERQSRSSRRSRRRAVPRAGTRRRGRRISAPRCRPHAARIREVLNGVGGSSSLIVRALGISLRDPRQQRGLHREAGDRRIVLHDDLDVDRLGERRIVAHHRVRVQLRHARRAHHHGGRAGALRVPAVADARARPFGGRAGDDGRRGR